eukprot:5995898-Prymnesium_polylepis.1
MSPAPCASLAGARARAADGLRRAASGPHLSHQAGAACSTDRRSTASAARQAIRAPLPTASGRRVCGQLRWRRVRGRLEEGHWLTCRHGHQAMVRHRPAA